MDTKNLSAPPRAQSRVATNRHAKGRPVRAGGVIHDNTRHTDRFTVIGNHLTQHPNLSGLAIGLGAHIQSLPAGHPVDIRSLTRRFPEGATRIAAALRELEAHGYLRRTRERVPGGRIVTRTVSCNQPGRGGAVELPIRSGAAGAASRGDAGAGREGEGEPEQHPAPPGPVATPDPRERRERREPPERRAPGRVLPEVPHPARPVPALLQAATDLLAGLHHHEPRLLLSARDTAHLAPGVAAWLERDVSPGAVRLALTRDLPSEGLRRPAALLAHRLTVQLPPPPPFRTPASSPDIRHPLQTCDGCERAFRAPGPGRCRDCRPGFRSAA
ncbi:helix-turn-helix domain-containing protein [Streptomyces sp. NPDC005548]|uniref:helix-turn-helix domain-containing protein n=1 Tax=Streptomyces sp. NPDC005548 TaxID=3364724 RepID=UPI0036783284